jgi:hypothetical protein
VVTVRGDSGSDDSAVADSVVTVVTVMTVVAMVTVVTVNMVTVMTVVTVVMVVTVVAVVIMDSGTVVVHGDKSLWCSGDSGAVVTVAQW